MAEVSAGLAAQLALTQQAIALEMLKQSADLQQQSVAALLESVVSVPVSATKGSAVNIYA